MKKSKVKSDDVPQGWAEVDSAAEEIEKAEIAETSTIANARTEYSLIDRRFDGDYAISVKRRKMDTQKHTTSIYVRIDNDLIDIIKSQTATDTASINAMLRFAIDKLQEQKKALKII